jgi:hypothetical protein
MSNPDRGELFNYPIKQVHACGLAYFSKETSAEFAELDMVFDMFRHIANPVCSILESDILEKNDKLELQTILEIFLKRRLISSNKTESSINYLNNLMVSGEDNDI